MGTYLSLEDAKAHLNIMPDYHDEDGIVEDAVAAAEEYVAMDVCVPLSEFKNERGEIPAPLIQAIKLILGDFYAVRESVVLGTLVHKNPRYESIIGLYRNYSR